MGRTDHRLRMVALLVVFMLFAGAASLRLGQLQVVDQPSLLDHLASRGVAAAEDPVIRGAIVDRNGTVLAQTAFVDKLAAWPRDIPADRRGPTADELSAILGLDERAHAELVKALASDAQYAVLAREVSVEQGLAIRQALREERLVGLALEPQQVRSYPVDGGQPGTTLASQLLGFVTADGRGRYGIEQRYDDMLAGRDGLLASVALPGGAGLALDGVGIPRDAAGRDVRLTIDADLQLKLEKQLYHAWVLDKADRVSGIVLDPDSGEVLAWASVPGYDAERFAETFENERGLLPDPIASGVYEPGSVMKMLTAAAALSSGAVKPRTRIIDSEALWLNGREVNNADMDGKGSMPFEDVIGYSRNVATAKVALRLENTRRRSAMRLYRTWQDFGIGRLTGIDIAGEEDGLVADPRERPWTSLDLANRSFGQGVATTQVQLATAFAAMVNGGYEVRPHLLVDDTGEDPERVRVVEPRVAEQLRDLLRHVTASVPWYAQGSLIRGYEVGGKTGTAQIWDTESQRYLGRRFNFSFVGYVGGDEPEAVIAVRIHDARPKISGPGELDLQIKSFELFRRIAFDVISSLGIRPSKTPGAGLPERGSEAARQLTPDRWRAALRRDRARASDRADGTDRADRGSRRRTTSATVASGDA